VKNHGERETSADRAFDTPDSRSQVRVQVAGPRSITQKKTDFILRFSSRDLRTASHMHTFAGAGARESKRTAERGLFFFLGNGNSNILCNC